MIHSTQAPTDKVATIDKPGATPTPAADKPGATPAAVSSDLLEDVTISFSSMGGLAAAAGTVATLYLLKRRRAARNRNAQQNQVFYKLCFD